MECAAPACIVTGKHDGSPPTTLGGLCTITALLFHQFWRFPAFWKFKPGEGLDHFWEFLKNFGLVGGLGLIMLSSGSLPASQVARHPLTSSPVIGPQAGAPMPPSP